LPPRLANHELVAAAWDGLDATQVWDTHVHLLGVGDSASGVYVNPRMGSLRYPTLYVRRAFFVNAACVDDACDKIENGPKPDGNQRVREESPPPTFD